MKILHVIRDLSVGTGGPVVALKGLAEAQVRRGHHVIVLTTDCGDWKVEPQGVDIQMAPSHADAWAWSARMSALLDNIMPTVDIVHLHMVWDYPVWAAAKSALRYHKPFILRPCGQLDRWSLTQSPWKKRVYMRIFGAHINKANAIHFTSEGERANAVGVPLSARSIVIPIGVSERFYKEPQVTGLFERRFPELTGRRIVLLLGRLHPKKQPNVAVGAFARVMKADDRLHLVLAGPGEESYLKLLADQAQSLGMSGRVTFTGPLRGEEVEEAYRAAEVFVLPSMQENFGAAIVEAMAVSCPVLISDRLDLAQDISIAKAGLICGASLDKFSAGLQQLLSDPALRHELGANGKKLVLEKFTWEPIAQETLGAYSDLLKQ